MKFLKSGGTRRITNIINRKLKANGNIIVIPSDKNGETLSLKQIINFNDGKITLYSATVPNSFETWENGDKLKNPNQNKSTYICVDI